MSGELSVGVVAFKLWSDYLQPNPFWTCQRMVVFSVEREKSCRCGKSDPASRFAFMVGWSLQKGYIESGRTDFLQLLHQISLYADEFPTQLHGRSNVFILSPSYSLYNLIIAFHYWLNGSCCCATGCHGHSRVIWQRTFESK